MSAFRAFALNLPHVEAISGSRNEDGWMKHVLRASRYCCGPAQA
jgi:hypothetical protein